MLQDSQCLDRGFQQLLWMLLKLHITHTSAMVLTAFVWG